MVYFLTATPYRKKESETCLDVRLRHRLKALDLIEFKIMQKSEEKFRKIVIQDH